MQRLVTLVHTGAQGQLSPNWDKNFLLNPGFRISQSPLGSSFNFAASTVALLQYTLDQWLAAFTPDGGTTAAAVVSRQNFVLGQGVVAREPVNFLRVQNSTVGVNLGVNSFHNIIQRMEGVRTLAGEVVTLSFWAQSSIPNKVLGIYFLQSFGSGGTPSNTVGLVGGSCVLSTSWQKFTLTARIPTLAGKVLGTNGDDHLAVIFVLQGGATIIDPLCRTTGGIAWGGTGTVDFANIQLEMGSTDSDFFVRPPEVDLLRCRRFYYYQANSQHAWYAIDATYLEGSNFFPTPMRIPPSLRFTSNAGGTLGLMHTVSGVVVNDIGGSPSTHGVTELYSGANRLSVGGIYYGFMEANARL